ncbi:MAG: outer membrane beta-barrel protein [Fibrobacter sp.]|uniref:outer membrane beta-barrel protein n=1 Tax=Fibrobacter sp. TaxID=35828 RepID=UPI0025BA2F3D|nr:outer membrane beta-barrel protein [Fibrobacter sp.]MBR4784999.1 outer membrane beta-barrel protein [Fibrobacter sp.]
MKKMFMFLASMSLVGTMAFAQDDYDYGDGYGDDGYGSSEPAPAPPVYDEGAYEQPSAPAGEQLGATDVEYKNMDANKAPVEEKEPYFLDTPFSIGLHLGLGFSMLSSTEICGKDTTGASQCTNYGDDLLGGAFEIGAAVSYAVAPNLGLAVVAEPSFEFKVYSANLGLYSIGTTYTDEYGWDYDSYYLSNVTLDAMMFALKVPVFLRFYPKKDLFVQLGVSFEFNLGTSVSYSDEDGHEVKGIEHQDLNYNGSDKNVYKFFDVNSTVVALNFGMGTTVHMGNYFADAEIRFILDMTPMTKFNGGFHDYTMKTYGYKFEDSEAKAWQIQLVLKPWF